MASMKTVYLVGEAVKTNDRTQYEFESHLQSRFDKWLGTNKVKVKVNEYTPKRIAITIYRNYGDWYKDPSIYTHFTDDSMFSWDKQILFGEGYFEGGEADFEHHDGRYIIYRSLENVITEYKEMARDNHWSRIMSLEYFEALDHFDFAFTFK